MRNYFQDKVDSVKKGSDKKIKDLESVNLIKETGKRDADVNYVCNIMGALVMKTECIKEEIISRGTINSVLDYISKEYGLRYNVIL